MLYLKNLFFILLLTSLSFSQYGQGRPGKGKPGGCEISGFIIDSKTNQPIEYASISLLTTDDNVQTGGITNSNGEFKIDGIRPGSYSVVIEFMGYSTITIPDVKLSYKDQMKKNFGKIMLVPSVIQLEAVKVIDDKPVYEFETDKLVYNASDDIVAGSGTAEDVLNKVPMVTVDQDGEVSLRGNPNVKILLNGRPNRQGGDVDNIPASLIEKVEVITSPSAKYDPEGMAGIINIVLKKGEYEGLNGSIKLNGKHNAFNSFQDMNGFTIYSNYQQEKYNLYSSLSINNRMRTQEGFRRTFNMINGQKNYFDDSYDYDFDSESNALGNSITIGADYSINKKIEVNVEGMYKNHYKEKINNQLYFQEGNADPFLSPVLDLSREGEDKNNYNGEFFMEIKKSFENPDKKLSFSMSNNFKIESEYETIITDTTFIDEDESSIEIDLNYQSPINDKSDFEIGYDGRFTNSKENMKYQFSFIDNNEDANNIDDSWEYNGLNKFNYDRYIHGFFAEYQLELNEKITIKPSLRIEYVNKNIDFSKNPDSENSDDPQSTYALLLENPDQDETAYPLDVNETNYFPNFNLTYNITDKKNLQFSISKRIERPEGSHHWGQLRPFPRNVYNDSFLFKGNPKLKPEFSTQYEISYKSPFPMGFYTANVYYRSVTDPIEWYDYDGNLNELQGNIITFKNAESANDFGVEFFMLVMGQVLGGGYNINELNDGSNDYQLNGKDERLNMYMRINLPEQYIKIFSFEFGFYYMKLKVPGGTLFGSNGTLWANTGISKSLFDDRASISFSINNIFDKGGFQMDRSMPSFNCTENGTEIANCGQEKTQILATRGGRTFSLSFKYHFGKMQEEKRRSRGGFGDGGSMDMGY